MLCSNKNEDGQLDEFTSLTVPFDKEELAETDFLYDWPTVESALEEHGLSCALNVAEGSMTVSTTTKTRDANIIYRARDFLELLSVDVPFSQSKEILGNKMKRIIIDFGNSCSAFRRRYTEKEFLRRWGYFNRHWKSFKKYFGRSSLYDVLGCFMFVPAKFTVVVYGPHQGIKEARRIVLFCMQNNVNPMSRLVEIHDSVEEQEIVMAKLMHQFGVSSLMGAASFMKETLFFREQLKANFAQALLKMQDTTIEMIVEKCSSLDPEVRANATDTLRAIVKLAPPELAIGISISSIAGRLLRHALGDSQTKSVLTDTLSICISLLDPEEKLVGEDVYVCEQHNTCRSTFAANPEVLLTMLDNLGDLLKLLDDSSVNDMLLTTYGRLQPPLGLHRLKIVELISLLLRFGCQAVEKHLICLGAVPRILDLLFEYPFNNFLHHHVVKIIESCLKSKYEPLVRHVLHECDIVGKILEAEKNFSLTADSSKPTVAAAEVRSLPRRGNIGHLRRISSKILEFGNKNSEIQENSEWTNWHTSVLSKRQAEENVNHWLCGRPELPEDMGGNDGRERKRKKLVVLDIDGS